MKRTAYILFCLLFLVPIHQSLANSSSETVESLGGYVFATPEQTWDHFKSAILSGDFETAHKCCCERETKSVQRFARMDAEKRKSIVESMGNLEKVEQQENAAKYKLSRNANGTTFYTFVYFEKENGVWKIANY